MIDLLAISPPGDHPDESVWIERLLHAGLARYHLRKTAWSRERVHAFLRTLPESARQRVVLHDHHDLVAAFGLAGCHVPDRDDCPPPPQSPDGATRSRSLHRIDNLDADTEGWDYVFLSPVFDSLSKPGHGPSWDATELGRRLGRRARRDARPIHALGGITAETVPRCAECGFDGAVLHSALWTNPDPGEAFEAIKEALR